MKNTKACKNKLHVFPWKNKWRVKRENTLCVTDATQTMNKVGGEAMYLVIRSRKGRFLAWNPWNWDIEVGDKLITADGKLYRAEKSSGWGKRAAGELYPREIKPPIKGAKAVLIDGVGYWEYII